MTLVISGEEYDSLWQPSYQNYYNLILDDNELGVAQLKYDKRYYAMS